MMVRNHKVARSLIFPNSQVTDISCASCRRSLGRRAWSLLRPKVHGSGKDRSKVSKAKDFKVNKMFEHDHKMDVDHFRVCVVGFNEKEYVVDWAQQQYARQYPILSHTGR